MGGKTKTMTGFDSNNVFNSDSNLFFKDYLRSYVMSGNSKPIDIYKMVMASSNFIFNYALLDKYNILYEYDMYSSIITDYSMLSYCKSQDPLADTLNSYSITKAKFPRYEYFLNLLYSYSTGTELFVYDGCETYSNIYSIDGIDYSMIPVVDGNNIIPQSDDIEVELKDVNGIEPNIFVSIPEDTTVYYIAHYTRTDTTENKIFLRYSDIVKSIEVHKVMLFPIKKDYEYLVDTSKEVGLLSKFGFAKGSLDDAINNSELKDFCLSFSCDYDNYIFADEMAKVYGVPSNFNNVKIVDGSYTVEYAKEYVKPSDIHSDFDVLGYVGKFDGIKINLDEGNFLVPIPSSNNYTIQDRYNIYRDTFKFLGVASKIIEIEWYQTGFFQWAMKIVATAIAILTQQYWAIPLILGSGVIYDALKEIFGEDAAKCIMYTIAIAELVFGDWNDAYEILANIAASASLISSMYFDYEIGNIVKELKSVQDDEQELEEDIQELQNNAINVRYNTMSVYDSFYDTLTKSVYEYNDLAFKSASPFDNNMYEPFKF